MSRLALAVAALVSTASAATTAQWKSRTIYQVLTDRFFNPTNQGSCSNLGDYCGGTWRGIIDHLDYIQSMGFDAIWISPMPTNSPGGYHGYWQTNMYQPNPYFGTAGDLKALSTALHARGMYLMLDIVANHQAQSNYDPSTFYPFNNASFFHDCNNCPQGCNINNYTDLVEMEHCRLAGLLDLNQSNPYVAQQLITWINNVTTTYGVDGLRVDTLMYVFTSYWQQFFGSLNGMFATGEIFDGDVSFVANFQKESGIPSALSYPMFFTLRNVFAQGQSMNQLQQEVQQYASSFADVNSLGSFLDNHDNPRFLNALNDQVAYQNALAYVLLSEGIPIVYYGTEAGFSGGNDPYCREPLWPTGFSANSSTLGRFLSTVNGYRKSSQIWNAGPQVQRYSDNSFYAFTRGQTFVALTNVGQNGQTQSRTITYHPYSNGQKLCNLFNPSDCLTVSNGQFQVSLNGNLPKVYSPSA